MDKSGVQMVKTSPVVEWSGIQMASEYRTKIVCYSNGGLNNGLLFEWHQNTGQPFEKRTFGYRTKNCLLFKWFCYLNPHCMYFTECSGDLNSRLFSFWNGRVTQIPDTGVRFMAYLFNFYKTNFPPFEYQTLPVINLLIESPLYTQENNQLSFSVHQ